MELDYIWLGSYSLSGGLMVKHFHCVVCVCEWLLAVQSQSGLVRYFVKVTSTHALRSIPGVFSAIYRYP